jgi:hypothetical protein
MPREGQLVTTPMGKARVVGGNPLKGTAVVELETQVTVELPVGDLKFDANAPPERNTESRPDKET